MRRVILLAAVLVAVGLVVLQLSRHTTPSETLSLLHGRASTVGAVDQAGGRCRRSHVVGRSAMRRPIKLIRLGCGPIRSSVLVVGCIHGDECAGVRVAQRLVHTKPLVERRLDVIRNLNPDGRALGERQNGRGVDLNRNFPAGWRLRGRRWDPEYAGPRPLSEPETRLAVQLIARLRPAVTIWFHQHYGDSAYVRAWGASVPAARLFARLAGLAFRPMPWPSGTAPNWQNHRFPGTASFVVEYPRKAVTGRIVAASADAVRRLASVGGPSGRGRVSR